MINDRRRYLGGVEQSHTGLCLRQKQETNISFLLINAFYLKELVELEENEDILEVANGA